MDRQEIIKQAQEERTAAQKIVDSRTAIIELASTVTPVPAPVEPCPPNTHRNAAGGCVADDCPPGFHRHLVDEADVTKGYGDCVPDHVDPPVSDLPLISAGDMVFYPLQGRGLLKFKPMEGAKGYWVRFTGADHDRLAKAEGEWRANPTPIESAGYYNGVTKDYFGNKVNVIDNEYHYIEVNGLTPDKVVSCVLEALDGIPQFCDPLAHIDHGDHNTDAGNMCILNGWGNPTNNPKAIARSETLLLRSAPWKARDDWAFYADFLSEDEFVLVDANPRNPWGQRQIKGEYQTYRNSMFDVVFEAHDFGRSEAFIHDNHLMTVLADAGGQTDSTCIIIPRRTFDLKEDQTLIVEFSVDPYANSRRGTGVIVWDSTDTLVNAGNVDAQPDFPYRTIRPKAKSNLPVSDKGAWEAGNSFSWDIWGKLNPSTHAGQIRMDGLTTEWCYRDWGQDYDPRLGPNCSARYHWKGNPLSVGRPQDIDCQHEYRLELTTKSVSFQEKDGRGVVWNQLTRTFSKPLVLKSGSVKLGLYQQLYHSVQEYDELYRNPDFTFRKDPIGPILYRDQMIKQDQRHWGPIRITVKGG